MASFKLVDRQTLIISSEFDCTKFPQLLSSSQADLDLAAALVTSVGGNIKENDVKITRMEYDDDFLDMNIIHPSQTPIDIKKYPMVLEIFFPKQDSKKMNIFCRLHIALTVYDGVISVHFSFNILEALELIRSEVNPDMVKTKITSKLTPYHYREKYPKPSFIRTQLNFLVQVLVLLFLTIIGPLWRLVTGYWYGPLALLGYASERRVFKSFPSIQDSTLPASQIFKGYVASVEKMRANIRYPMVKYLVNFTPLVAIGGLVSLDAVLKVETRVRGIFISAMPPPQMGYAIASVLSNAIVWNNYGSFNPNISIEIRSIIWDWPAFPKSCFPYYFAITVQRKFFPLLSMSESIWERNKHFFVALGEVEDMTNYELSGLTAIMKNT